MVSISWSVGCVILDQLCAHSHLKKKKFPLVCGENKPRSSKEAGENTWGDQLPTGMGQGIHNKILQSMVPIIQFLTHPLHDWQAGFHFQAIPS